MIEGNEETYKRLLAEKEATIQALSLSKRSVEELLNQEQKKSTKYSQAFLQLKEVFDARQSKVEELYKTLEAQNKVISELRVQLHKQTELTKSLNSSQISTSSESMQLRLMLQDQAKQMTEDQNQYLLVLGENQDLRRKNEDLEVKLREGEEVRNELMKNCEILEAKMKLFEQEMEGKGKGKEVESEVDETVSLRKALQEKMQQLEEEKVLNAQLKKDIFKMKQEHFSNLAPSPVSSSTVGRPIAVVEASIKRNHSSLDWNHNPGSLSARSVSNNTSPLRDFTSSRSQIFNKSPTNSALPKSNTLTVNSSKPPLLPTSQTNSASGSDENFQKFPLGDSVEGSPCMDRIPNITLPSIPVPHEEPEELPQISSSTSTQEAPKSHRERQLDKVENDLVMFSRNFLIHIKGGTLEKIIERCTNEAAPENSFMDTFLLTYRTYISPSDLIDKLFDRYNTPVIMNSSIPVLSSSASVSSFNLSSSGSIFLSAGSEEEGSHINDAKRIIRLRVGNIIKRWLSNHYHDFNDNEELIKKMQVLVEKTFAVNEKKLGKTIMQLLTQKPPNQNSNAPPGKPPPPIVPKSISFLDLDPTELARQLCLFEQHLYQKIHPKECLNQSWNKPDRLESAPNICQMIEHFNKVGRWVVHEVISQSNLSNRVKVTKQFIKVAIKCRELNNFNCCQEIIAGFGSAAVYRLQKTWGKLYKTEKQLIALFNVIKELMATDKSFNKYRMELKNVNPPCIPYLGVFLTDLTFIEEGNPNYLTTVDNRTDIINFEKMRKVAAVIENILIYQPTSYHFEKVPLIYEYIQNGLPQMDDKTAFEQSRQIEPREDPKK